MKTSVSSYSFAQLGIPQTEMIERAKEIGFDAIEFTEMRPPEGMSEIEYAKVLRAMAAEAGIEISCHSVGGDLLGGEKFATSEEAIQWVLDKVDVAEALGTKMLRHNGAMEPPSGIHGFHNIIGELADACRRITEYAEAKGIKTMVENHGYFCQDSDRVELLVNTVDHENFGLLVDMGNFLCADENPATAVGRCARYAVNVHVKDFLYKSGQEGNPGDNFFTTRGGAYIRGTVPGHGVVPIKQCMNALKAVGYDGYVAYEFEGMEKTMDALVAGYKYIKSVIGD